MSPNLASALAAAESLPTGERRELITLLLQGLDDPQPGEAEEPAAGLSEAWRQEIARRSAGYDTGQEKTVPWQEVQARWQRRRASGG